jgi:hypothetical protein
MLFSFSARMEKVLRTSGDVLFAHLRNVFGKNHSKAPGAWWQVSTKKSMKTKHDSRIQVPVDVAVEKPRAGVVRKESNGYEVRFASANAHNITDDWVDEVVGFASSTPNHMERMLVRDILARELVTGAHVYSRRAGELDAKHCWR